MKRLLKICTFVLAFVMLFSFAACGESQVPPQEEVHAESISLAGMQTQFAYGDEFSADGLTVTVRYSDGTSRKASPLEYTVDSSAYNANVAGSYEISVKFGSLTSKYIVTVAEQVQGEPEAVSLALSGMKLNFDIGESFSAEGIVVTAHYSDESDRVLSSEEYEIDSSAYKADTAGDYEIVVKFGTIERSYTVTVAKDVQNTWEEDGVLKILLISGSFGDDTIDYMWHIANSMGVKAVLGQLFLGGGSIRMHADNAASDAPVYTFRTNVSGTWNNKFDAKMSEGLEFQNDWDFIGFNGGTGPDGTEPRGPEAYLRLPELIAHVRKFSGAELMWNMTWADANDSQRPGFVEDYGRDQMAQYNGIVGETHSEVIKKCGITRIVPTGTAIQNARSSYLGDTLNRDTYHLTLGMGRYTAGLTLFLSCTGMPLSDVVFRPEGVTAREQLVAIESAENALKTPFEVTQSKYR